MPSRDDDVIATDCPRPLDPGEVGFAARQRAVRGLRETASAPVVPPGLLGFRVVSAGDGGPSGGRTMRFAQRFGART